MRGIQNERPSLTVTSIAQHMQLKLILLLSLSLFQSCISTGAFWLISSSAYDAGMIIFVPALKIRLKVLVATWILACMRIINVSSLATDDKLYIGAWVTVTPPLPLPQLQAIRDYSPLDYPKMLVRCHLPYSEPLSRQGLNHQIALRRHQWLSTY